jgi:hypothetical protein
VFTTQYVTGNIMPYGKQRSLPQLFDKHGLFDHELFDNATWPRRQNYPIWPSGSRRIATASLATSRRIHLHNS